jgi:tungstate transport system ATP-binding protein
MIRISNLSRRIGDRTILDSVNLEIRNGEIFTLIGPSGSGKTTLLRLLDLLDRPTTGAIYFDGIITDRPETVRLMVRRRMAMVFQKPAVLNSTVTENVAAGLKFRGIEREEIARQVSSTLELVGLSHLAGRRAVTLSGGEIQRLAIARAVVTRPDVLFLDEPTANLDPANVEMVEELILRINRKFHTTILLSTHDMIQGQRLAHRIGVIIDGHLVQTGDLNTIFYHPANRAIASFVGIEPVRGGIIESCEKGLATIMVGAVKIQAVSSEPPGSKVALCIRPEEVTVSLPDTCPPASSARNCLAGTITRILPYGPFTRVHVDCGIPVTALLTRRSCEELALAPLMRVNATIKATAVHMIPDPGPEETPSYLK